MRFGNWFLEQFEPDMAKLLYNADLLTDDGLNNSTVKAWIKAVDYAYAHQDWHGYVSAMCYCAWAMFESGAEFQKQMIHHINNYMKFSREFAHKAIDENNANYKRNFISDYTIVFSYFCNFYKGYYQIDDAKIEELLNLYENEIKMYPRPNSQDFYYFARLDWALSNYNRKDVELYLRRVVETERAATSTCYVCRNLIKCRALIYLDRVDEAVDRVNKIITVNGIPDKWFDVFRRCENTNAREQQEQSLINGALFAHKPDLLYKFSHDCLDTFIQSEDDVNLLVFGLTNQFEKLQEECLRNDIADKLDNFYKETPYAQMIFYLSAYTYIDMLHRNDIHEVKLSTIEPIMPTPIADIYSTRELADYFLGKADVLGEKFTATRANFKYQKLRETVISAISISK